MKLNLKSNNIVIGVIGFYLSNRCTVLYTISCEFNRNKFLLEKLLGKTGIIIEYMILW